MDPSVYERRDGHFNPEPGRFTAKADRAKVFEACKLLSLAWWYTGVAEYAKMCAQVIDLWFCDEEKGMRPHLKHAQITPGQNIGRATGIIDFSMGYSQVLDAAALLGSRVIDEEAAPGWTTHLEKRFRKWNKQFLDWLVTSSFGIEESAEEKNHGT